MTLHLPQREVITPPPALVATPLTTMFRSLVLTGNSATSMPEYVAAVGVAWVRIPFEAIFVDILRG